MKKVYQKPTIMVVEMQSMPLLEGASGSKVITDPSKAVDPGYAMGRGGNWDDDE